MTQSLSKSEGMLKDIPQMGDLAKWPGFSGAGYGSIWGMAEKTADAVSPVTEAAEVAVKSAPKVAKAMAEKAADITTDTAKASVTRAADTVEKATGTVSEAIKAAPEPKVVFDPVVEAPVAISEAAVEAPAVLKAAAAKVEPKPIARSVSAVKKPKKS